MKPLNPIMAVLAIASVGVFPPRALANDGKAAAALTAAGGNTTVKVTVPAGVPIATEDSNSITKLTDILAKNTAAKTEAGARVADFLLLADKDKKSFVAADTGAKELRAVALAWAEKQTAGDLAMLYFVLGVGPKAPEWVKNDELLKKTVLSERGGAESRLRKALSRFTDGAQIKKGKEKDDAVAFLNIAVVDAKTIFDDRRPMSQVDESANQNANTGAKVPDTTGGSGSGSQLGASQQYGMKELYIDGAAVAEVAGAKDEEPYRISIKIYTRRDPETKELINEIGIFDITDRNKIFGRRFPAGGGDEKFQLDDRNPGNKNFELKFETLPDGNRTVTFGRPGEGGTKIVTSVSELYNKRADQVADLKNVVTVGGQEFYAAPQGGGFGALALYPKALIDNRRGDRVDPRNLEPSLYSEVSKRSSDGRNQNVPRGTLGGPHLGSVGGKDFHLEFNEALGLWEVKDGPGNLPPPKPKAEGETTGGGTTPGGSTTTTPGGKPPIPSGGLPIADLEMLLLALPECKKLPGGVEKLDKALEKTFGLVTCNKTNKPEDLQVFVLVPSSVRKEQQLMYSANETAKNLLNGRFLGHYLVLQFEKQVLYLDLLKPTKDGFDVVGFVADGATGGDAKTGFKDMLTFMDALTNHMGVKGEDTKAFSEVPARMKKIGSFVYIQAKYRAGVGDKKQLVVDGAASGGGFEVWPNFTPSAGSSANGPSASQYASLSGPANAMDGSVGSVDEPLKDEIALDKNMEGKAIRKQADIVVYKSVDPIGKTEPNQYFVMFRYDALDPKDPANPDGAKEKKTFRQKHFEVFNSSNPLPGSFGAQGLVGATVIKDRVASGYRFVGGTNAERGVLAVFQEKQVSGDNVKDKPGNCVGPIIWWGLKDREAALKICREDKF